MQRSIILGCLLFLEFMVPHMGKGDIAAEVLRLMLERNKPYSVNEIVEKCGKEFGKSSIQKTLELLVSQEKVVEKTFGKQKIYFVRITGCNVKGEVDSLTKEHSTLNLTLKSKQEKINQLETELKSFAAIPNLESLTAEKAELQDAVDELTAKLDHIRGKECAVKFSKDDVQKIEKMQANNLSAYRKRKRICNDMLEAILEGYPKSKKHLIEDTGIETDEAVGFSIPK